MDDSAPQLPPSEPASPITYKDRSNVLKFFGLLTIGLGCLCVFLILFILLGQTMAARTKNPPPNTPAIAFACIIYGGQAVVLVWLGIGSFMARRWARALLVILSWGWLLMGIFGIAFLVVLHPVMQKAMAEATPPGQPGLPEGMQTMISVMVTAFMGIVLVALPAIWLLFYGSRHTKATCEARDPVPRWTDACPLPVLGVCIWLAICVPMMIFLPFEMHGVTPFYGMYLTGIPGILYYLLIAALWCYAAWAMYRLDQRGWWVALIVMCLFIISTLLTYARHDATEMYHLMGYPEAQIDQLRQMGFLTGHRVSWITVLCVLPFFGYLLFIKKYFRPIQG